MKKLIVTALATAAIALPAVPAAAADADAWWGRKPCWTGEAGVVIWHDTPATEYQEIRLCMPIYPRAAAGNADGTAVAARAGVSRCETIGGGYRGVYVWWYDLDNRYHRTNTCVYVGP